MIVAGLTEVESCGISPQQNSMYYTPLAWATLNGHEEVVRILLGRDDIDPDKQDWHGRTPLWAAAKVGHGGVVKLPTERDDINLDK